ncbi:MAG: DUF2007 domain-containing protein [Prevotellaceae bacterium]|jgi:hypothetical protein|nr:DUF2007 domain-containing protein [Prevotellaceae bacterium]
MQELITVKIFNYPAEMYIAKSFLESEGIRCFVQDEFINQVVPFYTNAVNGIKLQVRTEQAEQAVRLLVKGGFAAPEDYELTKEEQQTIKIVGWLKNLFRKQR